MSNPLPSLFSLLLMLSSAALAAQEFAVSEKGDSVVLYANGTWDYIEGYRQNTNRAARISLNADNFMKPAQANRKVELAGGAFSLWFNDRLWKRIPPGEHSNAEYTFQLVKGDVIATILFEEVEVPEENLSQIALENAMRVAPDIRMTEREYRVVNGDTLIAMRMEGSLQGMQITYYSYYSSNAAGTVQLHTFTGQKLVEKYRQEIEGLLNGLVAQR